MDGEWIQSVITIHITMGMNIVNLKVMATTAAEREKTPLASIRRNVRWSAEDPSVSDRNAGPTVVEEPAARAPQGLRVMAVPAWSRSAMGRNAAPTGWEGGAASVRMGSVARNRGIALSVIALVKGENAGRMGAEDTAGIVPFPRIASTGDASMRTTD